MFTYALPTRPPHGFFPKGYEYDPDGTVTGEPDSFCRHGVVTYSEPLSDNMINNLEIIPFGDADRLASIVKELENNKYIVRYRELYRADKNVRAQVSVLIFKKSTVFRLHRSETDFIFDQLMEG